MELMMMNLTTGKHLILTNGALVSTLLVLGVMLGCPCAKATAADSPSGAARGLAPLELKLPIPAFMGTPVDFVIDTNIVEKPSDKPRPLFMAPKGVVNVALNKKVTSSDPNPVTGELDLVTDGDKESSDNSYLELHRKTQWVQLDLEKTYEIYVILVWHAHNTAQIYHDVVVQVADDVDFTKNVRTVFNNDMDNSSGLGIGTDKEYFENYEGKLIDAKGVKARYVRLYSKGSSFSALNRYTEVEVYSLPVQ
jgi:hypothetical protein